LISWRTVSFSRKTLFLWVSMELATWSCVREREFSGFVIYFTAWLKYRK